MQASGDYKETPRHDLIKQTPELPMKILLLDRDNFILDALTTISASESSMHLIAVNDSSCILSAIEVHRPSVVVVDLLTLDERTYQSVTQLRNSETISNLKIVLVGDYRVPMKEIHTDFGFLSLWLPRSMVGKCILSKLHELFCTHADSSVSSTAILSELSSATAKGNYKSTFSKRELAVMRLVCDGLKQKEIADKLKIAGSTVRFHMKSIYRKTKVQNSAALVKYSLLNNIINSQQDSTDKNL